MTRFVIGYVTYKAQAMFNLIKLECFTRFLHNSHTVCRM